MDQYISKVELAVNGQTITDFKGFSEKARELNKPVKLMGKTGFVGQQARHEVDVDYVVPQTGAFDWSAVIDGTLTVTMDGGTVIRFTGVTVQTIGEAKFDGENETTRTITLGATGRTEE